MQRYMRYSELISRGIVNNRQTLSRWMRDLGFPAATRSDGSPPATGSTRAEAPKADDDDF
jgi:hypothetical protein